MPIQERRLRQAARELEGCLPALSGFDREVIVLRGGLHGRRPLSRADTAERLRVGTERVRSAERSGLAGLRQADARQGCGLRSGAGREVAARRLAAGSVPGLAPLQLAARSPALVQTSALRPGRGKELGRRASPAEGGKSAARQQPRPAGLVPTSGEDSGVPTAVLGGVLAALLLASAGLLLLRRRRARDPYGHGRQPSVYPYAWNADDWEPPVREQQLEREPEPAPRAAPARGMETSFFGIAASRTAAREPAETTRPAEEAARPTVPADEPGLSAEAEPQGRRRRDRAVQAFGGLAASGAAATLLLGRLLGRRGRR